MDITILGIPFNGDSTPQMPGLDGFGVLSALTPIEGGKLMTSMAQIFDERGDGMVVKGAPVELDKDDRTPHLALTVQTSS